MNYRILAGLAVLATCLGFATPASGQAWGIGRQISAMARDEVLGRDLVERIRLHRLRQLQQFQQRQQGPPYGKAWGLRGGKPYTGNGNPLNGVPNGRPFQQPSDVNDRFRGRNGTFDRFRERTRDRRTFERSRGGKGFSRNRGFGGGKGRGRGRR